MPAVTGMFASGNVAVSTAGLVPRFGRSGAAYQNQQDFLFAMAARVVPAAAFEVTSGDYTGTTLWSPGAGGDYYGWIMVVRDQVQAMRGAPHLFSAARMAGVVDVIAALQGAGPDDGVQEGMRPDSSIFGYGAGGTTPSPIDNSFDFVDAVYCHFLKTGFATKFSEHETAILTAYNHPPVTGHLVDLDGSAVEFGFQDSIIMEGQCLCASLFRYRASRQIAEMLTALDRSSEAAPYAAELPLITAALESTLWDSERGLFYFCNGGDNIVQHSIAGSAYGVVLGAFTSTVADAVSDSLFAMLPGQANAANGCFLNGQVRHFPLDDTFFTSMRSGIPEGEYQNGGYWGTFTGWCVQAIKRLHPEAAAGLLSSWTALCRGQGNSAPYEAESQPGYDGWTYSFPYMANAALPLQCYAATFDR